MRFWESPERASGFSAKLAAATTRIATTFAPAATVARWNVLLLAFFIRRGKSNTELAWKSHMKRLGTSIAARARKGV